MRERLSHDAIQGLSLELNGDNPTLVEIVQTSWPGWNSSRRRQNPL